MEVNSQRIFWDLILPKILGVLSSPMGCGKRYFVENQDTPLLANRRPTGCTDLSLSPARPKGACESSWLYGHPSFLSAFIH